ncbi:MAG: hypothetical protein ACXIUV_06250 [Alkalilacustris sp.]
MTKPDPGGAEGKPFRGRALPVWPSGLRRRSGLPSMSAGKRLSHRASRSLALALGLACCLAGGPALSQSLTMRSGEHASFTRLTLPVPAGQSWQVGRTEDGYGVRLPDLQASIDTSEVFARIPRSRLSDLRIVSQGVDLILGCTACHANAFRAGSLLVIDIRDGAASADARFEARLSGPRLQPLPLESGFDWRTRFVTAPAMDAEQPIGGNGDNAPTLSLYEQAGPARDLLARQLARAAAQGLITAGSQVTRPGQLSPEAMEGAADLAQAALRNLRIDAQTGLDRARTNGQRVGTDRDGMACPPDHLFDVASWADHRPIARQIAHRRAGLLGEFDRPVSEAVEALARIYVHAGFGAEAVDLLTNMPFAGAEYLLDMARLLDEALPLEGSRLARHVGCDGPVALWAVLAAEDLRTAGVIDRAAVRRAFSVLPHHLRRHLGPALAQRFLELGDTETALAIRSAILRTSSETERDRLPVLEAALEMAQGRPEAASTRAATAADGNAPSAHEAVAVMAEARIAAGQPIAPGTLQDLIALAQEHRGTPLGRRLVQLEAIALTDDGRFDAAFATRDRLSRLPDGSLAAEQLSRELLARLAHRESDEGLLPRIFAEQAWRGGQLLPEDQLQLAQRLLDSGFPEEALDVFGSAEVPGDAAAAVMAQAALALGRPGAALRSLAGREGPEMARLRAEALLASGDHDAATGIFRDAGDPEAAVRAAWLGGDWADVARHRDGDDGLLAARAWMTSPDGAPAEQAFPDPAGPSPVAMPGVPSERALAEAHALLAASAELRSLVDGTLAAHPAPGR